jgi:rubrerythrin
MPPKRNKSSRPEPSPYARIDKLEKKFRSDEETLKWKLRSEKETRRDAEAELERVRYELESARYDLGSTEQVCRNLENSLDTVLEIVNRMRSEAHGTDYTSVEDFIFDQLPEELKRCQKCTTILNQFRPEIRCPLCYTEF